MNGIRGRVVLAITAAATPILLTACSTSEQQDYTVPSIICHTQINSQALLPLLPPGNEFVASSDITQYEQQTHEQCSMRVDSARKVYSEIWFFTSRPEHPAQKLSNAGFTPKEIRIHGDAAVTDSELIAYLECNPPGVPPENGHIYLRIYTYTDIVEDDAERMELLEEFARDYSDALWEKHECQG